MTEEFAKANPALSALTEYAQRAHNQQMRAYLDTLSAASPPASPSIWRSFRYRIEDWRGRVADIVRLGADWIDPYA